MHSNEHLGLQQHSVGELYPWTIMIRKDPTKTVGSVVPVNGATGYYGPSFQFDGWGESFYAAHRLAEQWVKDLPPGGGPPVVDRVSAFEELAALGYPDFTI